MQDLEKINRLNEKKFNSIPYSKRVIFLPQCLRNKDCKAKNSEEGWICINCGKCNISDFKEKAEKMGYRVFIAPGFSLVKKLIEKYNPKAVVGVSCESEMNIAKEKYKNGLIGQGLLLARDGCIETEVDWNKLKKICFGWNEI